MKNVNPMLILSNMYDSFHKVEKIICDYILENSEKITSMTIAEVANDIKVAESSIVRFCKTVGFSGFGELKVQLAKYSGPRNTNIYDGISKTDSSNEVIKKVFTSSMQCLSNTLDMIDYVALNKAIELMKNADKVLFMGVGSSSTIAQDAYYRFMRIGVNAKAVTDPHISKIESSFMTENSLAVAISHTGKTKETYDFIKSTKKYGAKTMLITSFMKSPIAQLCDVVVSVSSNETEVLNEAIASRIAHITVLDCIYTAFCINEYQNVVPLIENMNHILNDTRI